MGKGCMNPFPGATVLIKKKKDKKKKTKIKRGDIVCTCGALKDFYSTLYYLHDKDCVINKEK